MTMLAPAPVIPTRYARFSLSSRLQHLLMLVSFTILAITGLVQKYALSAASVFIVRLWEALVMAMAADTVIVTAEHIVPAGVIAPDHVVTPGPLVDYLVANV